MTISSDHPRTRRSRRARRFGLTLAITLGVSSVGVTGLAAWAGTSPGQSGTDREKEYKRVIAEKKPTAQEVVDIAGAPEQAARAADGSLLLLYYPSNVEDDEGDAALAWRMFDPKGKKVAEHAEHANAENLPSELVGTKGGFLYSPVEGHTSSGYFLDTDGTKHALKSSTTPATAKPGDVPLNTDIADDYRLFRPSNRTVAPISGVPKGTDRTAIDSDGGVWATGTADDGPDKVTWWSGGGAKKTHELPPGTSAFEGRVDSDAGTTVLPLSKPREKGLAGLELTTDGGKNWRTLKPSKQLPLNEMDREQGLVERVLADGRVLIGERGGRSWLADDATNGSFHAIEEPAAFQDVTGQGTTLYGIADAEYPSYDLVEGEGLWTSKDGSDGSWKKFDDGRED